ncbi:hypothetical protein AU198_14130 [Mycobacterium sp. GA-1199]|nr:hypothetical protein AU198_14130 [Mycobacterium sp. GA-1199]
MSYPPPPGGPPPGNPGPPQGYSGPYGPPPQQPPWQQQWPPGPPPKKRGNVWKWLLGGVALLAVIGVTVAVTVSVTSDSGDGDDPAPSGQTFGLASADDKGPANIITEDPSCAAWGPINDTFIDIQRRGWNARDPSIPAADWTPDERQKYEEVGRAAAEAAGQTVAVAKVTPHRVMRELFAQFIAYARAYSDAVPTYEPTHEHLAGVFTNTASTITWACYAITYGSAEARAPLIAQPSQPSEVAPVTNPASAERFLESTDPICSRWYRLVDRVDSDTKQWQDVDPALPASEWSSEQRAITENAIPVMQRFADDIEELGLESENPLIQDLATFVAQYRRAYAAALPTYTKADSYLSSTSARAAAIVYQACKAAES